MRLGRLTHNWTQSTNIGFWEINMELLLLERLSLLLLQRFRFNGLFNTCERQFKQAVATQLRVTTTAFNPVTPMSDQDPILNSLH